MKEISEVAEDEYRPDETDPEIATLMKAAREQGASETFLRQVGLAAGNREDHIADLKSLGEPRGKRHSPKTAPNPPYERYLDPHEETIFEEMLAGEHQPVTEQ